MAKFQIFTYMYRPIMEDALALPFEEFSEIDVHQSLDKKQEITDGILANEEKLNFEFDGAEYEHEVYIKEGGIYVFRIANNTHKPIEREDCFRIMRETNHPSCLVVIDNRKDRQVIAVEQKGITSAFGKHPQLTDVLETTLRKALQQYRLTLDIRPKYHTSEFWQVVNTSMKFKGIELVQFPFPYPNLPVISDMVGEYMSDLARRTNSEPTLQLKGQNKESVVLQEGDVWLLNAIKACAASGRPILIKPKGSEVRKIGVKNPVYEDIPNGVLHDIDKKDLFNSKYQQIVEFLNTIKLVYE